MKLIHITAFTLFVIALVSPIPKQHISSHGITQLSCRYRDGASNLCLVAWHPYRNWLALSADDQIIIKDTDVAIGWSLENNLLAIAVGVWERYPDEPGAVYIQNVQVERLEKILNFETAVYSLSWKQDGTQLAIATLDGSIYVVSIENIPDND